jgi:hypothetical protein
MLIYSHDGVFLSPAAKVISLLFVLSIGILLKGFQKTKAGL